MKKLDVTKPVHTRSGREARIVCTDVLDTIYPILVLIKTENQRKEQFEYPVRVTPEGRFAIGVDSDDDILNVPETPKLDLTKPVKTLDGHKARIIFTEAKGKYPIIALVEYSNEEDSWEEAKRYTRDGYFIANNEYHRLNLRNVDDEN